MATAAGNRALETPEQAPVTWANPDSGNSGAVRPVGETHITASGETCRPFEQTIATGDGKTQFGRGTACRQDDGTWKVISP